ncbi:hypothetical protein Pmani_007291 [Petrolisthes manimaculis]|uniref:Nuclear pore complex protein Nup214 n=1 Tax=Petrolisthes manimaculis TaxID=1843537 RepID=A0AAE1Q9A3_9EUCA|nr:hypothetical protein Pmani_007291 [Petrolisthes manimaculis]
MEEGPDVELTTDVKFIASHTEIFPHDEVVVADGHCNLVAVSPKYGLTFVACGTVIKVFTSKTLIESNENVALTNINTGASITHVASSCDGLTLLVVIIHNDVPHALFYEVRTIVPGCAEQVPFVSVGVSSIGGSRVHGLAWSPVDPSSVAIAVSPTFLVMITLRDAKAEVKTENIPARAVGWSPKGKQLTVGLSDGSLKLFKPDLTAVRTVPRPPYDSIGSVLSITWFTSTEFFIGYKVQSEEESHVMMYVNAPKAKDPRFVTYDYLCNDNQGSRPHMLYPTYFPEWSLLCVLSSRANQVGVLGRSQAGDSWCEYDIEEGGGAVVHTVSLTEETFPLGLAVEFTSQKIFRNKDESTCGPFPVLYTLSTGGELNIFHLVNIKPGVEQLAKPSDVLPLSGHRNAQQYNGASSYTVPKSGGLPVLSPFPVGRFPSNTSITSISNIPSSTVAPAVASSTGAGPLSGTTFSIPAAGLFKSSVSEQQGGTTTGLQLPSMVKQTSAEAAKSSFSFNLPTSSPFTATTSLSNASGSSGNSSLFTGLKGIPPAGSPFTAPQAQPAIAASGLQTSSGGIPPPSSLGGTKFQVSMTSSAITMDSSQSQGLKIPTFQLSHANTSSGSISQGKPAVNPIGSSTPFKTTSHTSVSQDNLKQIESQGSSKSQSPAPTGKPIPSLNRSDSSLLSTIASVTSQFDEELKDHIHSSGFSSKIANKEEMGDVRRSLSEVCEWTELMDRTSSELKGEVSQLHSEVLEGYTLAEEAKVHMSKNKNPRKLVPLSRPLDPHSRRQLDEIRSRYQYLQSQLVEVETRLHLDWAAFTNDRNKKKKHELPASETLYQALKKCHNLRRVCEKSVEVVCDRIKANNLNFLSSLSTSRCHYDEDEAMATLEKSLRETTITPKVPCSPFKIFSPEKQEKLERVLAQRQVIPLRKCSSAPKADLTCVDNLFSVCSHEGSPDSGSPTIQQSFSFGPQTFSTPRIDNVASVKSSSVANGDPVQDGTNNWQASGNHTFAMPELAGDESYNQSYTTPSFATKSHGTDQITKPQYEDITPPQTPDNKLESGLKTASPLLALSSLVSKVPTTTVADVKVPTGAPITDSKPVLGDSSNTIPVGGIKAQIMTSVPAKTNFTFKPVTSVPSLPVESVESSVPFSFTPFVPQSSFSFSVSDGKAITFNNQSNGQSQGINSGVMFKTPPSATVTLVSTGTSQPSISSNFSFKTPSFTASDNVIQTEASEELVVTESDTTSSSEESDTASNNTVVADNISYSGASDSADCQETCAANLEINEGLLVNTLVKEDETKLSSFSSSSISVPSQSPSSTVTPSSSIFTSSALSGSIFGSGKLGNVSEVVTTSASIFGGISSTFSLPSTGSLFNTSSSGAFSSGTAFGAKTTVTTDGDGAPTTTSVTRNIFGTPATTNVAGTLFGTPTTTTGSISGAPITATGSILEKSISVATTAGSIFGTTTSTTTTTTSASSGSTLKTTPSTTAGTSILGSTGVSASTKNIGLFGTTSGNLFVIPTTSSSVSVTTTTESFFGAKTTTSGTLFGINTTTSSGPFSGTTTKSPSIFGAITTSEAGDSESTNTSKSESIFGGPINTSVSIFSNKPTLMGNSLGASVPEATSSSVISSTGITTVTSSSSSTFSVSFSSGTGSISSCTQPTNSIFGGTVSTAGSSGLFNATTTTTSSSTFGQQSTFTALTTSSSGSAFSSLSSPSSGFETPTTTTTVPGITAFGQTAPQSPSSVFTQGTSTQSTQGSMFAAPATAASIFGNTGQSTSVFSSAGQSGSVFGNQPSTTGIFGGSSSQSSTSSVFGSTGGGSGFNSGTGASLFGQTAAATSPFSASSTTKQEAPFGSSGFGSDGGFFSGLGGKPSTDNANKNVFGSNVSVEVKPQNNLFGNANNGSFASNVFGSDGSGSNGSSTTFSTGGGTVSQSGFAVSASQSSSGFGGSAPFGGQSALGSSPTFGGGATFGSPNKMGSSTFGGNPTFSSPLTGSPASGGFGSFGAPEGATFGSVGSSTPTSSTSSGFSSFANQENAASFGGLAQQSSNAQSGAFGSGGNVFGGGSSFSSWR